MRGKIKSQVKVIMLFCIALILSDCQTEEHSSDQSQSTIQTVSIDDAKNFLAQSKSNSVGKSTNSQLENLEFDKIAHEKIKGSNQLLTVIPFATNSTFENKRILLLKIDNEIRTIVFSMYPNEDAVKGSFSGKIFSHTLDGSFITGFRAENGIIVSQFIESNDSTEKNNTETNKTSTRRVQLKEVVVQNNYRNTVHALDMFGSTGMYGDGLFGGGIGNSGGGGYSWDAGGGGISAPTPVQIIDALTGKAKCIFEKLKKSSSGFENAIKKFDGEFTVSHLKLTVNDALPADVYGQTQLPINFVTEIQISNSGLGNLSDLGSATVFAHEIIHAEIYRKMLAAAQIGTLTPDSSNMSPQQQINYVNSLKDNFPGLYDYYYKRWRSTWNHEMMANHYRSTIANIIQQFDNNRLPRSVYESIAWLGLGKLDTNVTTIAWDNLSSEQKAITTKLINEHFYNGPSNCK
ncbi:hypothetical protein [Flavobacterium sp. N502540]|uniref:hypothetical protein n=1 Tax=Flavobacterium sp. N502540 TaxID=2986838 RepID=UPI002224CCD5|nr:hypothetical protein [Flavobacterium sp. N502540]